MLMKKRFALVLTLLLLPVLVGCSPAREERPESLVRELILEYGARPATDNSTVTKLLDQLSAMDPEQGARWRTIMALWDETTHDMTIRYEPLPAELEEAEDLCLVVLGFQLNPDGSIKDELAGRLQTALDCASQIPGAYVLCTGGGTAANNPDATEAGQMAAWLEEHGLAGERLLVEDQSLTTGQNAMFSLRLLREQAPGVKKVALVTSDYHIPWGTILFAAENTLSGGDFDFSFHRAYRAVEHEDYPFAFQAAGLLELAGESETAWEIYRGERTLK